MKQIQLYILLSLLLAAMSCEDVIEIDTKDNAGDLVIDAWVDTRSQTQEIRLTLSQGFFDNTVPTGAAGAEVSITNITRGETYDFAEGTSAGYFSWTPDTTEALGAVGDQLRLDISYEGSDYSSTTMINRVPEIDSISQEFIDDEVFLDDGIYLEVFARDFEGQGDAYWIKAFKNGEFLSDASDINIAYDAGFDAGSGIDGIIFITPIRFFINEKDEDGIDTPWEVGEESYVEIHSISQEAFNFMEIARDQILNGDNGIFALPLANARSNIFDQNGQRAQGFFNVAAVSSLSKVIE